MMILGCNRNILIHLHFDINFCDGESILQSVNITECCSEFVINEG